MEILSHNAPNHHLKEFVRYTELRQLAYNIAALQQEKQFHSLAVLSFFSEEGKTLFCAAVAMAYSESTRSKVLVFDTTTLHNRKSLVLRDCFNGSTPGVDVMSLEELHPHSSGPIPVVSSALPHGRNGRVSETADDRPVSAPDSHESDFSLIKRITEDQSKHYGLVLLDTAPLHAKNRSSIDPLLAARLSGASVLLVSQELLHAPKLNTLLKVVEDPSLHLIGVVSNEGYER